MPQEQDRQAIIDDTVLALAVECPDAPIEMLIAAGEMTADFILGPVGAIANPRGLLSSRDE